MLEDSEFYDNPNVQAYYRAHRAHTDNPNDALERPLFLELAGDLSNLDIIDLGCGNASFGREALLAGARSYTGVEVSHSMVALAQQMLVNTSGKVCHESIATWRSQPEQADLISSRLALHYVEHLAPVFREMYQSLRLGGRAIVSVEHPIITSSFASLANGRRTTWTVDDYFKPGARVHNWLGSQVTKYHHTLEEYFSLVTDSGFELESLRESCPRRENFLNEAEYDRRLRIPLFLFIAARKPS
jgi:SAM-dependent methyltransferase